MMNNNSMPTNYTDNDPDIESDPVTTNITTLELAEGKVESKVTPFQKNRERRSQAYKRLEKKYFWLRNFTGLIVIALLTGLLLTVASLKRVSNQNLQEKNEYSQQEQRNESLMTGIQALRVENDNLVQGRIPGLIPLKFNDPLKLDKKTYKSIVFTKTEYNSRTTYEYLAVIQNNTADVIRPSSRLLFFDKLGVQLGEAKIAIAEKFGGESQLISLQPGESRSFSGKVLMTSSKSKPKYFKLVHQN
jgi:cell division protein FtsB